MRKAEIIPQTDFGSSKFPQNSMIRDHKNLWDTLRAKLFVFVNGRKLLRPNSKISIFGYKVLPTYGLELSVLPPPSGWPSLILVSVKGKIIISYFELDLRWYQNMQTFLKIRLTFSSRGRLNHQTFKMQSAPNSTSAFSCLSPTRLCLIFSMMVPYINYMCVSSTLFFKVIKSISDRNISRWFVC